MTGTTPIDTILEGDALTKLKELPGESVDCCITSPPYYGLRNYGCDGQIGLEESPEAYVSRLVEVFREVRRVLKKGGTLWLNLGDGFASGKGTCFNLRASGLKPKDLIGIPWMVAFALRADGWYLRQDIIWSKNNCMPESVTDRCTKSHEYIFLFAKSQRYYFDSEAIKEASVSDHPSGNGFKRPARVSYQNPDGTARGNDEQWQGVGGKRNKRSVWQVNTKPFKEAHFATMPEKLIEPCILAGTSERGVCPECGAPWIRRVERESQYNGNRADETVYTGNAYKTPQSGPRGPKSNFGESTTKTIGWLPSCSCSCEPVPAVVLDPFFGAGTTGLVAKKLGRHFIGIELNEAYIDMAQKRIAAVPARLDRWAEAEG